MNNELNHDVFNKIRMTPEQRDAIRIALVHLIMASVKDPMLEKTIKILKNMID